MYVPVTSGSELVSAHAIGYRYPSAAASLFALANVNLAVRPGEILKVSGRNGSGKTTLLRILAGELTPTTGHIRHDRRLSPVYLDQNSASFVAESLTVLEQVSLSFPPNNFLARAASPERRECVRQLLSTYDLGLEHRLASFIAELSGGQRQIVALVSLLVGRFNLWLLDEFTAGMDQKAARVSRQIVEAAAFERNMGVVYASHIADPEFKVTSEIALD